MLASPQNQTRTFATTQVPGWPGCFASRVTAGHAMLGTYSLHQRFHYRSPRAARHSCEGSLVLTAKGLRILPIHPHLSWIRLSLPRYMTIPSTSLQDFVCHQSASLNGYESPAPSLLYPCTSSHLSRESRNSWPCPGSHFLLQFAKLSRPPRLWAEATMLVSCYEGDSSCKSNNLPVSLRSSSAPPRVPAKSELPS